MTHTKGGWTLPVGVTQLDKVWDEKGKFIIADFIRGKTDDEGNANARLIAASPDLLEALKAIHEAGRMSDNPRAQYMADIASAAIKRATGDA